MGDRTLALVSFARAAPHSQLLRALASLGYDPRETSPQRLCRGHAAKHADTVVFLLGGRADRESVVTALDACRGLRSLVMFVRGEQVWDRVISERCCDFAAWPCPTEELSSRLDRLCEGCAASATLGEKLAGEMLRLNLIGTTPVFLAAVRQMQQAARCLAPVVISGETGTGKELMARGIHYLGSRADGPFIAINCGALPDHLIENELFGHERGAYTDARTSSGGAIGEADGGTLFLDEVETLTPKAQVALLRFLQSREYRPLGSAQTRHADVRVLAAGNVDLRILSARQALRSDLYFRLNVLSISLPPLRDRTDDIALLAQHFIDRYCGQYGIPRKTLHWRSLRQLRRYHWPGNVRELENLVHRGVVKAPHIEPQLMIDLDEPAAPGQIQPADAGPGEVAEEPAEGQDFAAAKARAIENFEKHYLSRLLAAAEGNVSRAARLAGKERRALGKLLKKHGIKPDTGTPSTT
jgi:DNA-binding NtrC family response regulator